MLTLTMPKTTATISIITTVLTSGGTRHGVASRTVKQFDQRQPVPTVTDEFPVTEDVRKVAGRRPASGAATG
jgi:hypothetical protein